MFAPHAATGHNAPMKMMSQAADGAADVFEDALADGLPDHGFWSAPAVVAVSGGADSVGLLLGLQALTARRLVPSRLVVAHARHDLRTEAAADADAVAALAAAVGVPCVVRSLGGRRADGVRGEGVEGRARRIRYAFLTEVARDHGARAVLVGHTADDQAETILHRCLRGTGLGGLAGMARARPLADGLTLLRPLLGVSRRAVRDYVARRGQAWCEDATNADVRFARNFLRHRILAGCEAGPYPAASAALVRLGEQAAGAAAALRSAAEHLLATHARHQADGSIVLHARPLARLDAHLLGEVWVGLWQREGWPRRDMSARHYRRLVSLLRRAGDGDASATRAGPPAAAIDLPGGVHARLGADGMLVVARGTGQTVPPASHA